MKKLIVMLLFALTLSQATLLAQCPPGAFAYLSSDQTCATGCSVLLLGWPQGSTVNIYGGNPLRTISSVPIPGTFGNGRDSSAYTCVPCNVPLVFASVAPESTSGCVITTIGVLPIKFSQFVAATQNDQGTLLSWKTTGELAPVKYSIQKSFDGRNFTDLATINGKQQESNTYSFQDRNSNQATVFYRIKGTELSGKTYFSEVAMIKSAGNFGVSVYPNPSQGEFKVSVPAKYLPADLQVINVQGAVVYNQKVTSSTTTVNQLLAKGIYQVKITGNDGSNNVQRLIKN